MLQCATETNSSKPLRLPFSKGLQAEISKLCILKSSYFDRIDQHHSLITDRFSGTHIFTLLVFRHQFLKITAQLRASYGTPVKTHFYRSMSIPQNLLNFVLFVS